MRARAPATPPGLPHCAAQTATVTAASAYMAEGVDNSWDFGAFSSSFRIEVQRLDDTTMEFDMIGERRPPRCVWHDAW
jgi:hypothetical protein